MHAHRRLTLLALILLAVACGARPTMAKPSAASAPRASLGSSPSAEVRAPDLRGTKASPLVIETAESADDRLDKQQAAKFRELDSSTSHWIMLLTAGMLGVAAFQAWMFLTQLQLMKRSMTVAEAAASAADRSVETMQDTARRQLRAYLSIDRAWIEFPEPGVPSVTVVIKNAGQTPAHDLSHWIHQWIETYPLKIQLPVPPHGFVMSASLLGSGATHDMCITHPKPIIKLPFLEQIGTPDATIYVYGEITYKDVFGEKQFLKYRLMHGGPHKQPPGILSPCEEGNEAT